MNIHTTLMKNGSGGNHTLGPKRLRKGPPGRSYKADGFGVSSAQYSRQPLSVFSYIGEIVWGIMEP